MTLPQIVELVTKRDIPALQQYLIFEVSGLIRTDTDTMCALDVCTREERACMSSVLAHVLVASQEARRFTVGRRERSRKIFMPCFFRRT